MNGLTLVPVNEFNFPEPSLEVYTLTCQHHPTARYRSKNPHQRNLHLIKGPDGYEEGEECDCSFSALAVIVDGE